MKKDMKKKSEEYWKKNLTPEQYKILREKGTEQPFTGALLNNKKRGMYQCAACGQDLFSSDTKFQSGSGWPSFWDAVNKNNILLSEDNSFGMNRVEVRCVKCGSHLGHVFSGGPKPTGKYYCINSAALEFKEKKGSKNE